MAEKMFDAEEQSDEIFALQSIYGDDIFVCDNSKIPYEGNFTIYVQNNSLPFEVQCQGKLKAVKHLFPINLYFLMPSGYPSSNPPDLKISCLWLTSDQLDLLSKELHKQWKEGNNCAVIYNWINFLEFEVFNFLDLTFPINLSEEEFVKLTRYNERRKDEIFRKEFHECPICFCQQRGNKIFQVGDCKHIVCTECLTQLLMVHITDGNINALKCPAEKCDVKIFPTEIKYLIPQQDFERYERLLLQITLDVMKDVDYCPRLKCGQPVIIEKGDKIGLCQFCNFAFCTLCKSANHGFEKCKDKDAPITVMYKSKNNITKTINHEELLVMRHEYLEGSKEDRREMENYYGRKAVKDMLKYFNNEKWIAEHSKKCPRCDMSIEKYAGCNKMHCSKCNTEFCWTCMETLKGDVYAHFRKKCVLF